MVLVVDDEEEEGGAEAVESVVALEASELRCWLCRDGDLNDTRSLKLARLLFAWLCELPAAGADDDDKAENSALPVGVIRGVVTVEWWLDDEADEIDAFLTLAGE